MPRICQPIQHVSPKAGITNTDNDSRLCLPKMGVSPLAGATEGNIIIFPTAGAVSFPGAGQIEFP